MPRQAKRYGSWDTRGIGGAVSGDDDGIGAPDGKTGGDDGAGRMGQVISIYPYVPFNLHRLCLKMVQNFYFIGFPLSLLFIFINWKISPILFIFSIIVQTCNRKLAKRFICNQCVEDRGFLKFALAVGLVKLEERK